MPQENIKDAARAPGATNGAKTTAESSAAGDQLPEIPVEDLMRHAGVPEEVVSEIRARSVPQEKKSEAKAGEDVTQTGTEEEKDLSGKQESATGEEGEESPESEAEQTTETEEATEAEPKDEEEEQAAEEGEPEEAEPKGEKPNWYQKRMAKFTRQKERLEDRIEELEGQLSKATEGRPEPTPEPVPGQADSLAHIASMTDLQKVVTDQRKLRDWCVANPDGVVFGQGTKDERVVTPEEVRGWLIGATHIIEDAPRKAQELQTRAQFTTIAQQEWPELFDRNSEVYQTARSFLTEYPAIAALPSRDFVLGLMVEGWKTFKPRIAAKVRAGQADGQQNGNGEIARGSSTTARNDKEPLPEALRRKLPPIPKTTAPNTPRGSRVPSPTRDAAAAVERLAQEGGSPEAAIDAIAAIERQNLPSSKRTPAPV